MTTLRQKLIDEIQLCGFSPHTQDSYVRWVAGLAQFHHRSPDQIVDDEIKAYLLHLLRIRKLAVSSLLVAVSALRFFFGHVLHRPTQAIEEALPRMKKPVLRPKVYSVQELARLFGWPELNRKHRAVFMTTYAAGLRVSEVCQLRIEQVDQIKDAATLYQERLRPQFHFTSRRGWLNDPNGLVFMDGGFHLFYQHNSYGWNWGNMHWGHAVSRDLERWQALGDALFPTTLGTAYSGSVVVDRRNTAGFGTDREPALVSIYTAAGGEDRLSRDRAYSQCLAYSTDRGGTWSQYAQKPVLPHIVGGNRDPKVICYAPQQKWKVRWWH
jgi:hypothetical protein